MKHYDRRLTQRFLELPQEQWAISAITYGELLFGLEAVPAFHVARVQVADFVKSARILDWPASAAIPYAEIRYRTRKQPLNDRDMFLAAHAIAIGATLVTNNTQHFSRMGGGLRFENWLP